MIPGLAVSVTILVSLCSAQAAEVEVRALACS